MGIAESIMCLIGISIVVVLCCAFVFFTKEKMDKNTHQQNNSAPSEPIVGGQDVESDLLYALRDMNCQPEVTAEDDRKRIDFIYQNEKLEIHIKNNLPIVRVVDFGWYGVDKKDIDKYSDMIQVINRLNMRFLRLGLTYNTYDDHNRVYVTSIGNFFVYENIKKTRDNLEMLFNDFFCAHHIFMQEMLSMGHR